MVPFHMAMPPHTLFPLPLALGPAGKVCPSFKQLVKYDLLGPPSMLIALPGMCFLAISTIDCNHTGVLVTPSPH